MERITTDTTRFFNELRKELLPHFNHQHQDWMFTFCQIGQLADHAFSFSLYGGSENKIVFRKWDAALDGKRYLHIYNLDRLAVTEKAITASDSEINGIHRLFKPETFSIVNPDTLALDGLHCELLTQDKDLKWNTDEQMNEQLHIFIKILRDQDAFSY
ncbi:hypothetical protein AAEO56_01115 [Flavobacterium sp. DGU11]|uniref:Uncharacterized protein n=1 Tax=Flavobacterium arundinis TaxID=3139143 RepID=A0ABU9HSF5_9FLAO